MKLWVSISLAIISWFSFSISLSAYNKWLFGTNSDSQNGDINHESGTWIAYPLLTTSWHMLIQFALSLLLLSNILIFVVTIAITKFLSLVGLRNSSHYVPLEDGNNGSISHQNNGATPPNSRSSLYNLIEQYGCRALSLERLKWPPVKFMLLFTVPCALSTALDIGFSNLSLSYLSLSTYTIFKSTTPIFVFLVAVFMKMEKMRWSTLFVILGVFSGVLLVFLHDQNEIDSGSKHHPSGNHLIAKPLTPNNGTLIPGNSTSPPSHSDLPNQESSEFFGLIIGSVLVLTAAFMSGIRWALTQRMIHGSENSEDCVSEDEAIDLSVIKQEDSISANNLDPNLTVPEPSKPWAKLYTLYTLTPIMGIFLLLLSLIIEHPFTADSSTAESKHHVLNQPVELIVLLMSLGGFMAFCMVISEFWILELTSAVTLSIFGLVKEVLTVVVAAVLFGGRFY